MIRQLWYNQTTTCHPVKHSLFFNIPSFNLEKQNAMETSLLLSVGPSDGTWHIRFYSIFFSASKQTFYLISVVFSLIIFCISLG